MAGYMTGRPPAPPAEATRIIQPTPPAIHAGGTLPTPPGHPSPAHALEPQNAPPAPQAPDPLMVNTGSPMQQMIARLVVNRQMPQPAPQPPSPLTSFLLDRVPHAV